MILFRIGTAFPARTAFASPKLLLNLGAHANPVRRELRATLALVGYSASARRARTAQTRFVGHTAESTLETDLCDQRAEGVDTRHQSRIRRERFPALNEGMYEVSRARSIRRNPTLTNKSQDDVHSEGKPALDTTCVRRTIYEVTPTTPIREMCGRP